jgi:hypothetical protein
MSSIRLAPSEDVIFHALQNELILLNLKTQRYFALNAIGSDIWNRLIEHGDIDTVAGLLTAEYDVDPARLRIDLETLISNLTEAGLLQETAQQPTGAGV